MADIPDMDKLIASIRLHEGTGPVVNGKFMPYNDSLGNPTIAWGHLISKGITNAAGMQIFRDDLTDVRMEAEAQDWWAAVANDDVRSRALCEILFNLGLSRLNGFVKALGYLREGDFGDAANEFRNSTWFGQVGKRAVILTEMIETGQDPS